MSLQIRFVTEYDESTLPSKEFLLFEFPYPPNFSHPTIQTIMASIPVAILATGMVGQRMIERISNHPSFISPILVHRVALLEKYTHLLVLGA